MIKLDQTSYTAGQLKEIQKKMIEIMESLDAQDLVNEYQDDEKFMNHLLAGIPVVHEVQ